MRVFVISDTHFGHKNIIDYCNRPFQSVEEMDKEMIKNWNKVITNDDIVLHLGDFGLGSKPYIKSIIQKLNGKKILIMGNHDHWTEQWYKNAGFYYVSRFPILYANKYLLSHAPLEIDKNFPYINCYGHIHTNPNYVDTINSRCYCVERIGYTPVLLFEN